MNVTMLWRVDGQAPQSLAAQIAANVRRAVADGTLGEGDRLPTAAELADLLEVHTNTVLAAYRSLRDEGLLEFRRGRGVRVRAGVASQAAVAEAARHLIEVGLAYGYRERELADLVVGLYQERDERR